MEFKETDLPGIGKKYSIITSSGDKITVIMHITGKREIFVFEPDDYDEPSCDVVLSEEEANQLGSVLMGAYYRPEQEKEKEVLIENLAIEWIKVPQSSPLTEKSIKEADIRKRSGVTVIAIIKKDKTIINPRPDEIISAGDTLVVVGTREQVENFIREFGLNA
ncbi:cation:proton antiporter regulatory subunit [Persephonella atlantica]|uniref:Cation:proton antiporter regulatory subunit n=1 Tax=Persephonella atlantica TaxID=2699429 RepID=A0ABS1GFU6_9AQUI|nr:cation:proton antiporter regulatory subunit [Persephonella atlantica]MBK3331768.1 cation:proton antiporter regulatory subunit [Persephonella atlantica]